MNNRHFLVAGAALVFSLTGCGGGGSDNGSDNNGAPAELQDSYIQATLDATSNTAFTYFNLTSGQVVAISDAEAETSEDWHIAFRRYSVKLNSGASGPGNVQGAVVVAQDDFYDASGDPDANVFLNATADSELEHLLGSLSAPDTLVEETLNTVLTGSGAMIGTSIDMGWFWYSLATHTLSANAGNGWLLRSGEGNSYARFRATDLAYSAVDGLDATFEFDVQTAGTAQFATTATFVAQVGADGGEVCFDFDSDSTVACSGAAWDLKLGVEGRNLYLRSNGGVSGSGAGAAFGPFAWAGDLDEYTSATMDPGGTPIAFLYSQDSTGGVFVDADWYAYNLTGLHNLHPNFRVYWIDTNSTDTNAPKYALQIISYYNTVGVGGYVTLRWTDVGH